MKRIKCLNCNHEFIGDDNSNYSRCPNCYQYSGFYFKNIENVDKDKQEILEFYTEIEQQ